MKKCISLILTLALICALFSGCSGGEGPPESSTDSQTPLKIVVDFGTAGYQSFGKEQAVKSFIQQVIDNGGPADLEVEVLSGERAERESAIARIRTEVLTGKGPDVFILRSDFGSLGSKEDSFLFPLPEKAMQSGSFLPLDDYIPKAQYTDWSKLTPQVMTAGRYNGKQMILPLAYSFNATLFHQKDIAPDMQPLPWMEAATGGDPVLRQIAGSGGYDDYITMYGCYYISDIIGNLADYTSGQLLFTEDELREIITTACGLCNDIRTGASPEIPACVATHLASHIPMPGHAGSDEFSGRSEALTIAPLPDRKGGVSVGVLSYAAINASTKRAEEAFLVLDTLLSTQVESRTDTQDTLWDWLCHSQGISIHSEVGQKKTPLGYWFISEANFQELDRVRGQITGAKICNELDYVISKAYFACRALDAEQRDGEISEEDCRMKTDEIISEAYTTMLMMLAES